MCVVAVPYLTIVKGSLRTSMIGALLLSAGAQGQSDFFSAVQPAIDTVCVASHAEMLADDGLLICGTSPADEMILVRTDAYGAPQWQGLAHDPVDPEVFELEHCTGWSGDHTLVLG